MWCLLPELAEKFKRGLADGAIDPAKLNEMTTQQRVDFLSEYVGDAAKDVNKRFERSLLLKNQDAAILRWAKETAGITDARRKRMIEQVEQRKAERFERTFNPTDEQAFLGALAEQKIGTEITRDEAKTMFDLSKQTEEARAAYDPEANAWSSEKARAKYGAAKVVYDNYVGNLKNEYRGMTIREMLKVDAQDAVRRIRENPEVGSFRVLKDVINKMSDLSIATVASLDNSFMGRQGLKVLMTRPKIWLNAARESFKDIAKTFGGQEALDLLQADVLSRPNAMNGNYEKAKILNLNEEQFPTSLPERIPYVGKAFTASEAAFKGTALRMRTDLFDLLLDKAKENGVDVTDKYQLESIGKIVNSLTAKGTFKQGTPGIVKAIFWAPKMLKANIDTLTAFTGQDISTFAKKEAWTNLFKIASTTALILAMAKSVDEDSVELDPRSSDFGKIIAGDTRFDITGGAASIITLASRMLTNSYKSSSTDKVVPYGTGFGEQSRWDVITDFLENKVTPPVGVMIDVMKGETFDGETPTFKGELQRLYTPIAVQNVMDYLKNPTPDRGIGVLADFVGISSNSYAASNMKTGIIPEDTKIKNEDFISQALLYARAVGTDPETAFNRIFTGQKIRRIDNGTIIVERIPVDESQAIKKTRGGDNPAMKLDHTIPLQLGGSNSEDNLKLVTTSEWSSYTPVENRLGELLKDGIITKNEAQKYIVDFKNGDMTKEEIFNIK
jgi:hypothetical protein